MSTPVCFVIGPFGEVGSQERQWFDFLVGSVVRPALEPDYEVQSALDTARPGDAVERIKTALVESAVVIADLTYAKPNVYYELGIRHAIKGPCVLVRRSGEPSHFNLGTQEIITIRARYDDTMDGFAVVDLPHTQKNLSCQVASSLEGRMDGQPRPLPSHVARFYDWSVIYSNTIAADWLGRQTSEIQDAINQYEGGGGLERTEDKRHVRLFAEYLALKGASGQKYDGKVFYILDRQSHDTVFGYGVFRFPGSTVLIEALGTEEKETVKITFRQPARQVTVFNTSVDLSPYQYVVDFRPLRGRKLCGEILHPDTATLVGATELVPSLDI